MLEDKNKVEGLGKKAKENAPDSTDKTQDPQPRP